MRCFPNNKPWVTKDIKASLNRNVAFRSSDREEMRRIQRELKDKIRDGKECYRRKLESKLSQNNMREVWSGMRTITSYRGRTDCVMEGDLQEANKLNLFFNRFEDGASAHITLSPPSFSPPFAPSQQTYLSRPQPPP